VLRTVVARPDQAAEAFIADYNAVVAQLTSEGGEPSVARPLAGIAGVAEPRAGARRLLENFEAVLRLAKKTHPEVAHSIALTACRARDPLETARLYMKNYDRIVKALVRQMRDGRTELRRSRFEPTSLCRGRITIWRSSERQADKSSRASRSRESGRRLFGFKNLTRINASRSPCR
jgi:hypothetical protein